MLTISFPGYPKVRAIIIDEPVNGVSGIVECGTCEGRMVLSVSAPEEMSTEIDKFIKCHNCEPLARVEDAINFAERLKKDMRGYIVRLVKRGKVLREF